MHRILIIVPTYNEADNIRPLVAAITEVFRQRQTYQFELLFADDESPDGTAEVIRELQADNRHIHLTSGPKLGLGRAYLRAFTYARSLPRTYFAIVMMDADLSHRPADIPRLLDGLEHGADYVIGSRYVPGGSSAAGYAVRRRLQSVLANGIAKRCMGLRLPVRDLTGGFKAIRYSALQAVPVQAITAKGYVFQVCLLQAFAKQNFVIREVPIVFEERQRGESKLGCRDVVEFLRTVCRLNPHPLRRRLIRPAADRSSALEYDAREA